MDRRVFLQHAGFLVSGAALAGCVEEKRSSGTQKPAAHEAVSFLKGLDEKQVCFFKQDAKSDKLTLLSFDELQGWLGGNNSSLSFMLSACAGQICPVTVNNLAQLGDAKTKHIVISTDPSHDGPDLWGRLTSNYMEGSKSIRPDNAFIIYPASAPGISPVTGKEKTIEQRLAEGTEIARDIQHKMGLPTLGEKPWQHNSTVLLYNQTGKKISEADGNDMAALRTAYSEVQRSNGKAAGAAR